MSNVFIIIPTYWTWGSERADGLVEAVYDQPTPVDGESTLPRLLESLTALAGQEFSVLVLTAVTHPELEPPAANRVEGLINPYRTHYPIAQTTEADAALIRWRHPSLASHVKMCTHAGVRNLQLLLPHALGAALLTKAAFLGFDTCTCSGAQVRSACIGIRRKSIGYPSTSSGHRSTSEIHVPNHLKCTHLIWTRTL